MQLPKWRRGTNKRNICHVDFTDTTVIYTITNGESPSSEWSVTINIGPEPPAEFYRSILMDR